MPPTIRWLLMFAALGQLEPFEQIQVPSSIDTGSVVALKLLNPTNEMSACIVSSNVYCDRAETVVLGKG